MSGAWRGRAADARDTVPFTFDGKALLARPGDTLAAALLADGVRLVGRSFKYHRPRGILGSGVEEPNALVTVGEGGRAEPNTRATDVMVYPGLVARSQNAWPDVARDWGAVLQWLAPALPAGFYYKTFFGPAKRWLRWEWVIRRAAGLGAAPQLPDPERYTHRAGFCDVLVVGGGPAGIAAAEAAAAQAPGARVWLVEQDAQLGGGWWRDTPDAPALVAAAEARLAAAGVTVFRRTTASGWWDDNFLTLIERRAEPGAEAPQGVPQRLWHVRAGEVVLASGALELPLTFAGNDRPGVMLARAVRHYIHRHGVVPGTRAVVVTASDEGYATAQALHAVGCAVAAVLDTRASGPAGTLPYPVFHGAQVIGTKARAGLVSGLTALVDGGEQHFTADLVAMSGGFVPQIQLWSQASGKLAWDAARGVFLPASTPQAGRAVGEAADPPHATPAPAMGKPKQSFVDFQNDVSIADLDLAWLEGYHSIEHIKRYTTLGMATDQGKTGNLPALGHLARASGLAVPAIGQTTFRPPYTPVTMGALAGPGGPYAGAHHRRLPLAALHDGAVWQPAGYWHRPRAFPRPGESLAEAALREARSVRRHAGLTDVSTLGKFMVSGPDAAALLEVVCATTVSRLKPGRGRYTVMLREDGMVADDGTVWCLAPGRYLLTSSTGGADRMATVLSYVRQVLRPQMRVSVVNVQEHFAGIALAGPAARAIVGELTGAPVPAHMGCAEAVMAGVPVTLLAASYSGERAFEIHVEGTHAAPVWQAVRTLVEAAGGVRYGLDAMDLLRVEKGHVVIGAEADGRMTPLDLGLGGMLNKAGGWLGSAALTRPALHAPGRLQLVGIEAVEAGAIAEGAMLRADAKAPVDGHVTTAGRRVLGEGAIGLALLTDGASRHGQTLLAHSPARNTARTVRVTAPLFFDPAGERYRD